MYKDFYAFLEEPFGLTPDPKFLYLAPSHAEALSSMMHGIQEKKGVTVVTGEVGVGKTLLVHALLKDLNPKIKTAFIFQTPLDFETLLKSVLRELKVCGGQKKTICFLSSENSENIFMRGLPGTKLWRL